MLPQPTVHPGGVRLKWYIKDSLLGVGPFTFTVR
ncbi:hypothetical protein AGR13a_Lc30093 [Agrobacterium genomosp. 13 str. CFBP 6927]|uniref:Uncharacterized protein n=1 Tax=Agrobacterium genomosp. 13 str. CFBP 6927 TaxID=1183428 RepID=A0ABM9VLC3_9HYPH|nr:hypothetical protein AGR13a_Lc30093 [Agrobacterium genomosp. 13 str. CFBP 6927]